MSDEDRARFHRQVAEGLEARYRGYAVAPEGWRENSVWHWEQAGDFHAAVDAALDVADSCISRPDFQGAHQWVRRTLELLERLSLADRMAYDLRAYALTLAVLEFGGQYREGLDYANRMLRAARAHANHDAEVRSLLALGRMQRELGQLQLSEQTLLQARDLTAKDEHGELEADVRLHLAKTYQLQGRHMEALQELRLAEEEPTLHDDKVKTARLLTSVGDIYRLLGSARSALSFYNRALAIEQERSSLLGQGLVREKLALTLLDQGKLDEAAESAQESLRLRQMIGDIIGQARAYSVLGTITGRRGDHRQALLYHEQSRALDEQTQNHRGQGVALLHMGDEARALGERSVARQNYARALRLAQLSDDQVALARTMERMGDLNIIDGRREAANSCWAEALRVRRMLGHYEEASALSDRIKSGALPRS